VRVEPALVDFAAGDLHPRGSSAQIDLDTVSDPSTHTDLLGSPRGRRQRRRDVDR
jgi:hypothetical protein